MQSTRRGGGVLDRSCTGARSPKQTGTQDQASRRDLPGDRNPKQTGNEPAPPTRFPSGGSSPGRSQQFQRPGELTDRQRPDRKSCRSLPQRSLNCDGVAAAGGPWPAELKGRRCGRNCCRPRPVRQPSWRGVKRRN